MMIQANLPSTFWTYALRHPAWVFNQAPHSNDNITPYEEVIRKKPSLPLLNVFGCKAFVHNMNQRKDLTAKTKEVIHLGVVQDSQEWVFYDQATGRFFRGASVIFKEDTLPQINEARGLQFKKWS
ncbi:hypothetical protein O181_027997 [Austropuccinia psidii MF-1]|uniref:Retroviral polymerase SH3-like domain-containing protein n=1 Tax=Austropuccinia psidii MF-1 TaxID=1389203 RepID=A0A9Q3CTQ6_9BASI|nr:hypothetical protein [Austropuccinia psidii MF-1]